MPIVDSQIHLWENARMSPQHRQIPTYSMDDALQEMAQAGVDAAVIHPPSSLGEAVNGLAVEGDLLRRGQLGKTAPFQVGPAGRRYVKQLKRFLRRLGY